MNNSADNDQLRILELKVEALNSSVCLLSLHAMCFGLSVEICRLTRYFELLLESWQQCLPMGHACDVDFASWGAKVWEMRKTVNKAFLMHHVNICEYEYESEGYVDFKEAQQSVAYDKSSQSLFQNTRVEEIPSILICALRELMEVLMEISEFLNSPTEELIEASWKQWQENFRKHYLKSYVKAYRKWKISYSPRTLRKHMEERRNELLAAFKEQFLNDDEFEQVFDEEQMTLDIDGLSRFLFTHTDRFGVSHIDELRPWFSKELESLFGFVELWTMIGNDLQGMRKHKGGSTDSQPAADAGKTEDGKELESKVFELLARLDGVVSEEWKGRTTALWKHILKEFRNEIAQAGVHEKFKEFSKKKLYCIVGYLKKKNVYQSDVTDVNLTRMLEGKDNGMRKYINYGLAELDDSLGNRIKAFVDEKT